MTDPKKQSKPQQQQKQPLAILRHEPTARACGHEEPFKILQGEKPEYAERRKNKWISKRCPKCIETGVQLEVVRTERIKCVCGHEDDFEIHKGEQATFIETRRKERARKKCRACVEERRQREMSEAAKRREASAKTEKMQNKRLPDGTQFSATYEAGKQLWHGVLTVPSFEPLTGSGEGCVGLLQKLAKEWEKKAKPDEKPATDETKAN